MSRIPLVLLFAALAAPAAPASARRADAFYCYWVDAPARQAGVTAIFPGNRLKQKSITGVFAMDMQKRQPNKGRKYECPWKAEPEDAEEERADWVATHRDLGFAVHPLPWNPMTR
jgi:hypothetical protein